MNSEREDDCPHDNPVRDLLPQEASKTYEQIDELQKNLARERDARREDRFVFIVLLILLLDVVFFSVMPTLAGPIALMVLQLLVLIPLARRMGMEEVAALIDRVIGRIAGSAKGDE